MLGDYTYQSMQAFWWGGKIDPDSPKIVSVYDAFKHKANGRFTVDYERGCDWSAKMRLPLSVKEILELNA